MHQPFAETGAGQRRGALSIFDDRLGGDLRLCGVGRRAVDLDPVGAAIIIGAGFYIFLREQQLGREETVVNPPA